LRGQQAKAKGGDGLGVPYDGAPQLQKTVALAFGARGREGQGATQQRNKNVSEGKKTKRKKDERRIGGHLIVNNFSSRIKMQRCEPCIGEKHADNVIYQIKTQRHNNHMFANSPRPSVQSITAGGP